MRTRAIVMVVASAVLLMITFGVTNAAAVGLCGALKTGTCVIDGDTFYLNSKKYNLERIDAPELECGPNRALALKAARRLAALMSSGEVTLSRIRLNDQGNPIATATVNGTDIGRQLLADGLARRWHRSMTDWC